jgi:16S rRNA (adenine1518-N6/adenine1519-N6)-dimethyltransferase
LPCKRGFPPTLKRFGQHFLNDRAALTAIADAVGLGSNDVVVEIGPGRGALTELLLERAGRVIAVEIDRELVAKLRKAHEGDPRLTVIEGDILSIKYGDIVTPPFSVVGNVPYYITTPILFGLLQPPLPVRAVLLVQEEVAQRIVASPDSREYGALTVNVQAVAHAEIVRSVRASAFTPPPKVESSVIRITPLAEPLVPLNELAEFRTFVQAAFGMRRKQLANILRSVRRLSLDEAAALLEGQGIDPRARPETLSPGQLVLLMRAARS